METPIKMGNGPFIRERDLIILLSVGDIPLPDYHHSKAQIV